MKVFLYVVGIFAEVGMFVLIGCFLWNFTKYDALRILAIDVAITFFASLIMFEVLEEAGGKTNE